MMSRTSMCSGIWVVLGLAGMLSMAACGGGDSTTTDDGGADLEEIIDGEEVPDDATDVRDRTDTETADEATETDVPPTCGDGIVDAGEDCDDANEVEGDGCDNDCSYSCEASTECDDDNDCNGTESCTAHACADGTPPAEGTACTLPTGGAGVCRAETCVASSCGDGVVDTGEECDDANTDDTDACLTTCQSASCGDGHVQTGVETCDDGNTVADDGCENDCSFSCTTDTECDDLAVCNGAETCGAAHACQAGTPPAEGTACTLPTGGAGACRGGVCAAPECGNSTVDTGEECDDGNTDNTDACLSTCRNATCGDGFIRAGTEACDSDPARACTTGCSTTGTETCTDCAWSACVPPVEICNGLDENCTGGPDDGFTCVVGATGSCTTACSTTGSRTCSSACEWGTCTPPAETCNGLDDDCVGGPDNGFACVQAATQGCTTTCASTGSQTCSATCAWGTCTPPAEICNGLDDDCVSGPDNGFACVRAATRTCTTSCSSTGTETCGATCTWGSCAPPAEICNGLDDDCVAGCDNGFACCAGTPTTCTTSCGSTGIGTCTATCAAPAATACTPPVETCNGLDDDCTGGIDNGFACAMGATRACTVGACSGTQTCSSTCAWGACDLGPAPANDACAGAIALTPGTPIRGTTCAARSDYNPPAACVPTATTPAADVTYVLRVLVRSNVVIDLSGTTWDTVLYIYGSSACSGTTVACDDDGGTGNSSLIDTVLDPGTYYIVVDGYLTADNGPFVLNSTVTPVGDECTDAIPLTLTAARTTVTGNTTNFTHSAGSCGGGPTPTSRDVWYTFTLTQRELVFINTYGSGFDTQLSLITTGCAGVAPTCEDDDCTTQQDQIVRALPAGTYHVLVDGWNNANGAYTLNIEHLLVGGANGTTAPTALAAGAASLLGATDGIGSPSRVTGACPGGPLADTAAEMMYYWTTCPAGTAGTFTATTCNPPTTDYDTLIYLTSGVTGTNIACNDDIGAAGTCSNPNLSAISGTVPAGAGLFGFYVDGYGAAEGDFLATVVRP